MGSRREHILEELRTRLKVIRTAAGYATDAGETVFMGEAPELGPDDPPQAIAIVVEDETPDHVAENVHSLLPVTIAALAKANLEEPWMTAEAVLADIKRAVELADRTLGGAVRLRMERGITRTMQREAGSETVGIAIQYRCPIVEKWGDP